MSRHPIGSEWWAVPCALASALALASSASAAPPAGFVTESRGGTWNEACGVGFLPDGRALVWERGGRVWIVRHDGTRVTPPLVDLSDEVGAWRDHGLLGVATHPNFAANGWIYLLYAVDRHHLDHAGTPGYDPAANQYFAASIGRLVRYTATASSGFTEIDPASRLVLFGRDAADGFPLVHQSHGVGSLVFGTDGTLLVSLGDSASYNIVDAGGQVAGGYVDDALARGILAPWENVGSFRSQQLDSMAGKVLRLHPATGHGVPSNPWFDPTDPDATRSKVWCLGLRNPFRMNLVAGSGSHDPAAGNPGLLVIGDVGWIELEEWNLARGGENFGWPLFEGLRGHPGYWSASPVHPRATRAVPFAACSGPYRFRDLIAQASLDQTAVAFPDPCRLPQAESGSHSGAPIETAETGYLGSGYRDFGSGPGLWISLVQPVVAGANNRFAIRYANGGGIDRPVRVEIDGQVAIANLSLPPTGNWREWRVVSVPVTVAPGNRQVRIVTLGSQGPNVDAFGIVGTDGPVPVASAEPTFVHARPVVDWRHGLSEARVPRFDGLGAATEGVIGHTGVPVAGSGFGGYSAIGGPSVQASSWPEAWRDRIYAADYVSAWIRAFRIDSDGALEAVAPFDPTAGNVVALAFNPHDDSLWSVRWGSSVVRYRHAPSGNQPPVAVVAVSPGYGPSPLPVTLDASASTDPEGGALEFTWHFGDGTPSVTGAVVSHVFAADKGVPTRFEPMVEVRDAAGNVSIATAIVSVNNTPPVVSITSLYDGQRYPLGGKTVFPLHASISDAEHESDKLVCSWRTILVHNDHVHAEPPDPACVTSTVITGIGCGDEDYRFRIELTVTDAGGLSATDIVELVPDCDGRLACASDLDGDGQVAASDLLRLLAEWGGPASPSDLDRDGAIGAGDLAVLLAAWGDC